MYKLLKKSTKSKARLGILDTPHGKIRTPFFMPVATQGTIKQSSAEDMRRLKSQILLSNTYHLMLRPGEKLVKKAGGLHKFMDWQGPILTDSGGFQVFSLKGNKNKTGKSLVKMTEEGAHFKSYISGEKYFLSPERSLQIQSDLGVDMAVCLDECIALPATQKKVEESVNITTRWARRTLKEKKKMITKGKKAPLVHCVIQGGLDRDMRLKSLKDLMAVSDEFESGFDGFNIGGLSVGETAENMYEVLDYLVDEMPKDKPRYLMGVGYPDNILEGVKRGVDMFDCVIPSREGRHGRLFAWNGAPNLGKKKFFKTYTIGNAKFAKDFSPISADSKMPELRNLSKAYLHYLMKIKEPLGGRLASLNNLEFYLELMSEIRKEIRAGKI